jgi:predicted small lipoprotein YifL
MKKRISCIIALLVMMTVTGCGTKDNAQKSENPSNVQQEQNDKTNIGEVKVTEKEDEAIKKPQETQKPTDSEVKKKEEEQVKTPSNSANTKPVDNSVKPPVIVTKPAAKPPVTKPPVSEVKVVIGDIMDKVTKEVELPGMINLSKEEMKDFYYINTDYVEDFIIKVPMINVKATEIAIIKVKDVKNVENVKESINKRVKDLERTWGQYLPDQYELVKNHILKSNGQYVILIISEDAKKMEGTFDSFFKK